MKFRDLIENKPAPMSEADMKFQALAMAKELQNNLAGLSFIDMLAVMAPDNPAKKEIQDFETAINDLTTEVGEFIQKYIPDVADADIGDLDDTNDKDDKPEEKEPEEEEEKEEPEEEEIKKEKLAPKKATSKNTAPKTPSNTNKGNE
jgi:hypothetical protein